MQENKVMGLPEFPSRGRTTFPPLLLFMLLTALGSTAYPENREPHRRKGARVCADFRKQISPHNIFKLLAISHFSPFEKLNLC